MNERKHVAAVKRRIFSATRELAELAYRCDRAHIEDYCGPHGTKAFLSRVVASMDSGQLTELLEVILRQVRAEAAFSRVGDSTSEWAKVDVREELGVHISRSIYGSLLLRTSTSQTASGFFELQVTVDSSK